MIFITNIRGSRNLLSRVGCVVWSRVLHFEEQIITLFWKSAVHVSVLHDHCMPDLDPSKLGEFRRQLTRVNFWLRSIKRNGSGSANHECAPWRDLRTALGQRFSLKSKCKRRYLISSSAGWRRQLQGGGFSDLANKTSYGLEMAAESIRNWAPWAWSWLAFTVLAWSTWSRWANELPETGECSDELSGYDAGTNEIINLGCGINCIIFCTIEQYYCILQVACHWTPQFNSV